MIKPFATLSLSAALLALFTLASDAQHRKRVPRFEDYPVKQIRQGPSAPLQFDSDEQKGFSTYYQAVADYGANFAGSYAVVILTCGEKCSMVDYLDTRTGKIISGNTSNSGWRRTHDAFRDVEFRRGSRLIAFAGEIDEKRPNGWHFYLFEDGKLTKLQTIVTRGDFRKPLSELMK